MKKTIVLTIVTIVVVVAAVGGYFGYKKHRDTKALEALYPSIKEISIRTNKDIGYFVDPKHITYKEIFDNVEQDISETDKKIIEVQKTATPSLKPKTDLITAYLSACQDTMRCILAEARKSLSESVAYDTAKRAVRYMNQLDYYGQRLARSSFLETRDNWRKAYDEWAKAKIDVPPSILKLSDAINKVESVVPKDILVDQALINKATKIDKDESKKKDSSI